MDNFINIIGGFVTATPIILVLLKLFATEYVTNFTKELFNSKTNKKANLIFNGIVVILLISGISIIFFPAISNKNSTSQSDVKEQEVVEQPTHEQQTTTTHQKSDAELIYDGANTLFGEVQKGARNKKKRDSTIIANRGRKWVYQIGDIKDNEDAILELYQKLDGVPRVFVFKISKDKYFIFKNDEYSEDQISDSLLGFKSQIEMVEPLVKTTDLLTYCKAKEEIVETKPLKFRKAKIKIPCFICDK